MKRSPMKRGGPLVRRTPMARGSKPMPRVRPERLNQLKAYWARIPGFLREHPYCQWFIAECGLDEAAILANPAGTYQCATFVNFDASGKVRWKCPMWREVPFSEVVHHKNKRRGARLLDESEWEACSRFGHDVGIEGNKKDARAKGHLRNF